MPPPNTDNHAFQFDDFHQVTYFPEKNPELPGNGMDDCWCSALYGNYSSTVRLRAWLRRVVDPEVIPWFKDKTFSTAEDECHTYLHALSCMGQMQLKRRPLPPPRRQDLFDPDYHSFNPPPEPEKTPAPRPAKPDAGVKETLKAGHRLMAGDEPKTPDKATRPNSLEDAEFRTQDRELKGIT